LTISGHRWTGAKIDAWSCGVTEGLKKRSQDSVGSRQKSSAARKRVIRRAVPAVRKGNIRKGRGKDSAARIASRGETTVALGVQENKLPIFKTTTMSTDEEDIRQVLQEAHETGDGESNSWFHDLSTRWNLMDILEGPTTAQAQERGPDILGAGSTGASVPLVIKKQIKMDWYTETATPHQGTTRDEWS
jgi:hypothetical protein